MNLKGKVALVTGSSLGLGAEIIKKLAQSGADVIIHYNTHEQEAKKLEAEIKANYNVSSLVVKADITKEEDILNMVLKIIDKFKKIDILINNAALTIDCPYEEKTKDNFLKILDTNVLGTFLVTKYVGRYMLANKYGKIVNVSSNNAINCYYPESIDYDASKAAIISLTNNMAKYYAPYINVNCVCPGWIDTDINKQLGTDFKKEEINKIYLKRFASKEEVANVLLFLVSDQASYVNNAIIRVDGGMNG